MIIGSREIVDPPPSEFFVFKESLRKNAIIAFMENFIKAAATRKDTQEHI